MHNIQHTHRLCTGVYFCGKLVSDAITIHTNLGLRKVLFISLVDYG